MLLSETRIFLSLMEYNANKAWNCVQIYNSLKIGNIMLHVLFPIKQTVFQDAI